MPKTYNPFVANLSAILRQHFISPQVAQPELKRASAR